MKTVGQLLRETREKKGLTVAQAVEGTRSKSQVIHALEQDDFSRFPAPIYTRGFIKLYAEFLGLDPAELIGLYQTRHPDTDKVRRPASVLRPSRLHGTPPESPVIPTELNLPPPEPAPPAAPLAAPEPAPSQPVPPDTVPELPFDQSGSGSVPAETDLFNRPPPSPPPPPPPLAPVPPAPRPVSAPPRRRAAPPRMPAHPAAADEFELEVKKAGLSPTARDRAALLVNAAREGACRLPWLKILRWGGMALGLCLVLWLALTVIRGCVNRQGAAPTPAAEPAFQLPPVPEPPPLYWPDTPPRS